MPNNYAKVENPKIGRSLFTRREEIAMLRWLVSQYKEDNPLAKMPKGVELWKQYLLESGDRNHTYHSLQSKMRTIIMKVDEYCAPGELDVEEMEMLLIKLKVMITPEMQTRLEEDLNAKLILKRDRLLRNIIPNDLDGQDEEEVRIEDSSEGSEGQMENERDQINETNGASPSICPPVDNPRQPQTPPRAVRRVKAEPVSPPEFSSKRRKMATVKPEPVSPERPGPSAQISGPSPVHINKSPRRPGIVKSELLSPQRSGSFGQNPYKSPLRTPARTSTPWLCTNLGSAQKDSIQSTSKQVHMSPIRGSPRKADPLNLSHQSPKQAKTRPTQPPATASSRSTPLKRQQPLRQPQTPPHAVRQIKEELASSSELHLRLGKKSATKLKQEPLNSNERVGPSRLTQGISLRKPLAVKSEPISPPKSDNSVQYVAIDYEEYNKIAALFESP